MYKKTLQTIFSVLVHAGRPHMLLMNNQATKNLPKSETNTQICHEETLFDSFMKLFLLVLWLKGQLYCSVHSAVSYFHSHILDISLSGG